MISTTYALFDPNREFLNDFSDLAKTWCCPPLLWSHETPPAVKHIL